MRTPIHRVPTRRRILALGVMAVLVSLVGVQAAGGARGTNASIRAGVRSGSIGDLQPANQDALDAAAIEASSIAGNNYFTGAAVNADTNTVDVYLAAAPQSVIDQLNERSPSSYVIHNDAPNTSAALLKLEAAFDEAPLQAQNIRVTEWGPTVDGYLQVGVTDDVATAQSTLAKIYGPNVIQVYKGEPFLATGYRYADLSDWNGGDFIAHNGSGNDDETCTSGIGVHDGSTYYMLTASHCFWRFGLYASVHNTMFEANHTVYPGSSQTLIGSVDHRDDITSGSTTHDSALITAATGVADFHGVWNGTGTSNQVGTHSNSVGDTGVCDSGAFDGQICSLKITALNQTIDLVNDNGNTYHVNNVAFASDPNNTSSVANGTGDSGGPVYNYSGSTNDILARGMMEATSNQVTCTSNPTGYTAADRVCGNILGFVQMGQLAGEWGISTNIS